MMPMFSATPSTDMNQRAPLVDADAIVVEVMQPDGKERIAVPEEEGQEQEKQEEEERVECTRDQVGRIKSAVTSWKNESKEAIDLRPESYDNLAAGGKQKPRYITVQRPSKQCQISRGQFMRYYMILLFLLCFVTPVFITSSLNIFIQSAVSNTTYEVVSHHQWLTLGACVLMWGPSLTERLLVVMGTYESPHEVSVFLFLLGHLHILLRSVLHAVFAQQIHSITWQGNDIDFSGNSVRLIRWGSHKEKNRIHPRNGASHPDERCPPPSPASPIERLQFSLRSQFFRGDSRDGEGIREPGAEDEGATSTTTV